MGRPRKTMNYNRPIYEVGGSYRTQGPLRPPTPTWMWGCAFLGAVSCVGMCILLLVLIPIGFRFLPPENQAQIAARIPVFRDLIPTRVISALPTVDPAQATAAAGLLSTPASGGGRGATATPTMRPTATSEPLLATFRVANAQWVPQTYNNCGPANLAQALHIIGLSTSQSEAGAWLRPNRRDANVSPWQLEAYTNQMTNMRAVMRVNGSIDLVKRLVYNGFGVILETGLYEKSDGSWLGHYLTIIGWDDAGQYLQGLDSLENIPQGIQEPYNDLDRRWQHFNRVYIVVYRPEQESRLRELLGTAWDVSTNFTEALQKAQQEAQINPQNTFAWFNIGTNMVALGRYQEAAAAYDRARSGQGWPWRMLWYQFGPYKAYFEVGRYEDVIALATNTLSNMGTGVLVEELLYYRGAAKAALGMMSEAVADLQTAAEFNPNFRQLAEALSQVRLGTVPKPATLI